MDLFKYIWANKKTNLFIAFMCSLSIIALFVVPDTISVKSAATIHDTEKNSTIIDSYLEFKDALVFEEYAVLNSDDISKRIHFYTVGDYDAETDSWLITSLGVTEDQKLYETLNSLSENQTEDLKITFCTKQESLTGTEELKQIREEFRASANEINSSVLNGEGILESKYYYKYVFDSAEDIENYEGLKEDSEFLMWVKIGAVGAGWLFAIGMLAATIHDAKKEMNG